MFAKDTGLWSDQNLFKFKRVKKENQHERSEGKTRRKGVNVSKEDSFSPRQVPERT